MVEHRLGQHDQNQLELKLAYEVDPRRKKQRYGVEVYLYVPRTLGVSRATYPKERFYEETAAFVRMKTPQVALRALADPEQAKRWYERASKPLDRMLAGDRTRLEAATHRLKLLGCIYRRSVNDEAAALVKRFEGFAALTAVPRQGRAEALAPALRTFVEQLNAALERLRTVGRRCEQAAMPREVADVWRAVDEYVALVAEDAATQLVGAVDAAIAAGGADPLVPVREVLADVAIAAYRYRRGRSYPSYVQPDTDNEQLPYRRHVLKRIVCSVLFLHVRQADSTGFATDVVGMTAAALAMLFAILVTVWSTLRYDITSMAFIGIAVASYMVKDRIKEWGKRRLGRSVARYLPDKVVEVRDQESGSLIGACRETVSILEPHQVEAEVQALRHIDHDSTAANDGRPEAVIRYTKQMSLLSSALEARIAGIQGLNDIIRFNLSRFRERMDAPVETHQIVDPDTRRIVTVPCARVYHINLVLRLTTGHGKTRSTELERVRVILDQRGIKRVEPVGIPMPSAVVRSAPVADLAADVLSG